MRRGSGQFGSLAFGVAAMSFAAGDAIARSAAEPIHTPAAQGAIAPQLATVKGGVLLSWIEPAPVPAPAGDGSPVKKDAGPPSALLQLRVSRWDGAAWSEPSTIATSADFFANWADVPSVVEAPDGSLLAHWLQRSGPQTYSYDIRLARSTDNGESWAALGPLNDDRTQTEHGFASLVPERDGVRAFWLDGREMAGAEHGGATDAHGEAGGAMTLRTALVRQGVEDSRPIDTSVCECCPTAAALTSRGPIVVYRDRSREEQRDISIIRTSAGAWTEPRPVAGDGWKIAACPVNGPAAAARGSHLAVAWYTGVRPGPLVKVAFSSDDGATFGPAWVIDGPTQLGNPLGRVGIVLDSDNTAIVIFLDAEQGRGAVRLMRAAPSGMLGAAITVGYTETSRASGVPRLAVHGEWIIVVWTVPGAGLKAARLRPADVPAVSFQTWR